MSLKKIINNESGFTYTLEAIIGVFLIIGTIIFMTGNMPYTAQKTGEHSKVQLMNIGRDNLDLTLITSISETCPSCLEPDVDRYYLLCIGGNSPSDCVKDAFVKPNETINFKVYYTNGTPVPRPLSFSKTIMGTINFSSMIPMTYNATTLNESYTFPLGSQNEYLIQASDSYGWSNYVTVKVGYYFLESDTNGIFDDGNVSGIVYNTTGGVSGLTIEIWGYQGNRLTNMPREGNSSVTKTIAGGNFSFDWSSSFNNPGTGTYYIQAYDNGGNVSNMHRIVYSKSSNRWGTLCASNQSATSCDNITTYENAPIRIFTDFGFDFTNLNNIFVNNVRYNDQSQISITPYPNDNTNATLIANIAGDYYIHLGEINSFFDNANGAKTNSLLIHVLPLVPATGETQFHCINATELNPYMRHHMPAYVNYNLYLIGLTGNKFTGCPDFKDPVSGNLGEVINGYPTAEAVTVNKLTHIKYEPTNVNNIVEYRMVLWYK